MTKAEKQQRLRERQMRLRALRDRQRIENIRKHFDETLGESWAGRLPKPGNGPARERRKAYVEGLTPEQREAHREYQREAKRRSRARRNIEIWMTGYDGPRPTPGNLWIGIIDAGRKFGGGVPSDRKRNRVSYRDYRPIRSSGVPASEA